MLSPQQTQRATARLTWSAAMPHTHTHTDTLADSSSNNKFHLKVNAISHKQRSQFPIWQTQSCQLLPVAAAAFVATRLTICQDLGRLASRLCLITLSSIHPSVRLPGWLADSLREIAKKQHSEPEDTWPPPLNGDAATQVERSRR